MQSRQHSIPKEKQDGSQQGSPRNVCIFYRIFKLRKSSTRKPVQNWTRQTPNDVCILVRVFNISTDLKSSPNIRFYMDPWEMFLANRLRLNAVGGFVGGVAV